VTERYDAPTRAAHGHQRAVGVIERIIQQKDGTGQRGGKKIRRDTNTTLFTKVPRQQRNLYHPPVRANNRMPLEIVNA